jgi:acyl-coenzyme A thioesterase PaaI-like protein
LDLPAHVNCFGCGIPEDGRIVPHYHWDPVQGVITGSAHFGPNTQGPPGHAHGGALFTVLDEAMGAAAWLSGHSVLAVSVTVNYRDMVALGQELSIEAQVEKVEGRKVHARGRLTSLDGAVAVECTGLFIVVDPDMLGTKVAGSKETMERLHQWMEHVKLPPPNPHPWQKG